jgi:hypothetical protein
MNKQKIPKPKKFRQNHEVTEHFHPRGLARTIARNQLMSEGYTRLNRVPKNMNGGEARSTFAKVWREAASYAMEHTPVDKQKKKMKRVIRRTLKSAEGRA